MTLPPTPSPSSFFMHAPIFAAACRHGGEHRCNHGAPSLTKVLRRRQSKGTSATKLYVDCSVTISARNSDVYIYITNINQKPIEQGYPYDIASHVVCFIKAV